MVNVFRVTLALCLDVFLLKFNLPRVPRFLPFSQASLFLGTEIFSGIPLPLSPYQCHKVSSLYLTLLSNRRNLNNVLFLWPQCEAQGGFETRLHWNSIWGGGVCIGSVCLWPGQSRWIILTRKWFSPKVYVQEYILDRMCYTAGVEIIAQRSL